MRSADDLAKEVLPFFGDLYSGEKAAINKLIFEARKEALEEGANKATIHSYNYDNEGNKTNVQGLGFEIEDNQTYFSCDKQSILSLINELK